MKYKHYNIKKIHDFLYHLEVIEDNKSKIIAHGKYEAMEAIKKVFFEEK